ncbi:S-layer-like domain-containing protein [Gottschalkia acidurici 9a]|uniref:S-layer-like domain-containing protein n=1 Tax=Gottschalkia acidurici (strain ATCC 7906 / DSM 604 / BCRC 14475 / CIP 104303 / KCTC 5404 / NCIMB 10678 / 9a) TaxID=1128398 RepID=K0AWI8_GOTA9|nr:S-layer homology domain-containing protein [Gottschalkia acidurici]AFS77127.1 S-layer-like domain-containing protein [Gottschalkia acidurici 9a]
MKKCKLEKLLVSSIVSVAIFLSTSFAFAQNSAWSGQGISNFLTNGIEAPNVLKDEKYYYPITREEFTELVIGFYVKVSNINRDDIEVKENPFKDTTSLDVQRAYSLGIIQGISKDAFSPNDNITREQIATMVTRLLKLKGIDTETNYDLSYCKDKDEISEWALDSLSYFVENGIIKGVNISNSNLYIHPKSTATVEAVITILDRIAEKHNWLIKSKDLYINGFLVPNDTELILKENGKGIICTIKWEEITNIEKLKKDLIYILNSKGETIDDTITSKFINSVTTTDVQNELWVKEDEIYTGNCTIYITKHHYSRTTDIETVLHFHPLNEN